MNVSKLKGKIVEKGRNVEWLANEIGIDRSCLYRKLNCGEKITVGEAQKIKKALDITDSEAFEIFLAQ